MCEPLNTQSGFWCKVTHCLLLLTHPPLRRGQMRSVFFFNNVPLKNTVADFTCSFHRISENSSLASCPLVDMKNTFALEEQWCSRQQWGFICNIVLIFNLCTLEIKLQQILNWLLPKQYETAAPPAASSAAAAAVCTPKRRKLADDMIWQLPLLFAVFPSHSSSLSSRVHHFSSCSLRLFSLWRGCRRLKVQVNIVKTFCSLFFYVYAYWRIDYTFLIFFLFCVCEQFFQEQ